MVDFHFALTSEPGFSWKLVFEILPHVVWACVVVGLLWWIGRDSIQAMLRRVNKLGVAGVEVEFREELGAAAAAREMPVSSDDLGLASRRLAASRALMEGARILWVDDRPTGNAIEAKLFQRAGARITWAVSTADAVKAATQTAFDVAISDIKRADGTDSGLKTAAQLATISVRPLVVFYVGKVDGAVPPHAFGITDRPDELLHLVLDVLARRRS